jgi:hypothetical protein
MNNRTRFTRIILILLVVMTLLSTMAASCDPPDPTPTIDNRPSWEKSIGATETYGAQQWKAQLTAIATLEP